MLKISSSPERNTFQLEGARKRAAEDGKEVPEYYENFWKTAKEQDKKKNSRSCTHVFFLTNCQRTRKQKTLEFVPMFFFLTNCQRTRTQKNSRSCTH